MSERFAFKADEQVPDRADAPVKLGAVCLLQIGEETTHPWRNVFFKDRISRIGRAIQTSVDQTGHDFAKDRGVIFRLGFALRADDAELSKIASEPRKRALLQKAADIIGRIR